MDEKRRELLRKVRDGLHNNEFLLEYLPTVVLKNGRCAGAEALIRWRHEGRIVPPMDFVPFVENTPLAGLMTYWVIETVGRELGSWLKHQSTSVHIGINVPPELLGRGGVQYATIRSELADISHKLVLEVSERGMIDQLGVQELNDHDDEDALIALDDVQLSEISTLLLARVKVDIIKLDKKAVEQLTVMGDEKVIETVRAVAALPGLAIIGEGVETEQEANRLKSLGIEYAQGFYYSRPISAAALIEFFNERNGVPAG